MKLYLTRIASFKNHDRTDLTHRYEIDMESYKKILCVEYEGNLYDFNSKEKYYLLKRDERGFIDQLEYEKIKLGVEYALEVQEIVIKKDDLMELSNAMKVSSINQKDSTKSNKNLKIAPKIFQKQSKR